MGKKRNFIPKQNTHDLLVGTLSIGIPSNIYIPQLYMNFSADQHVVIYTCYYFILSFLQMNTWWYIHTATLYQLSCRWTRGNIYMLQLYINFSADEYVMIYTYRNFISSFFRWTRCNIYMLELYIKFSADEHLMIYTYRNFISTFLQMNAWYIHTATLY